MWKAVFDRMMKARIGVLAIRSPASPSTSRATIWPTWTASPRYDGVRDFLASREIAVSEEQVREIGDRKRRLVDAALAGESVEAFPGSVRWVEHLRAEGLRTAVVSSSTNATEVLEAPGSTDLFETTVDGRDIVELDLSGKPAPDGFLEAARRLEVAPDRAIVIEDALSGVTAGRAGGFGLVVGWPARRAGRAPRCRRRPGRRGPRGDAAMNLRAELAKRFALDGEAGPSPSSASGRSSPRRSSPCSRWRTATSACAARPEEGRARPRDGPRAERLPRDLADRVSRGRLRPRAPARRSCRRPTTR